MRELQHHAVSTIKPSLVMMNEVDGVKSYGRVAQQDLDMLNEGPCIHSTVSPALLCACFLGSRSRSLGHSVPGFRMHRTIDFLRN